MESIMEKIDEQIIDFSADASLDDIWNDRADNTTEDCIEAGTGRLVVDMQELCDLLIDNGYRLIRVNRIPQNSSENYGLESIQGKNATGSIQGKNVTGSIQGKFEGESLGEEMDPILEKELKRARKRAEELRFEAEINDPELINALKVWRRNRAAEENVPAYMVLPNIVLLRIAKLAPATREELQTIQGFGPKLSQKYSHSLLTLIATLKEEVPQ